MAVADLAQVSDVVHPRSYYLLPCEDVFHEFEALLDVEVGLFGGGFGVGELEVLAGGDGDLETGEGSGG